MQTFLVQIAGVNLSEVLTDIPMCSQLPWIRPRRRRGWGATIPPLGRHGPLTLTVRLPAHTTALEPLFTALCQRATVPCLVGEVGNLYGFEGYIGEFGCQGVVLAPAHRVLGKPLWEYRIVVTPEGRPWRKLRLREYRQALNEPLTLGPESLVAANTVEGSTSG